MTGNFYQKFFIRRLFLTQFVTNRPFTKILWRAFTSKYYMYHHSGVTGVKPNPTCLPSTVIYVKIKDSVMFKGKRPTHAFQMSHRGYVTIFSNKTTLKMAAEPMIKFSDHTCYKDEPSIYMINYRSLLHIPSSGHT